MTPPDDKAAAPADDAVADAVTWTTADDRDAVLRVVLGGIGIVLVGVGAVLFITTTTSVRDLVWGAVYLLGPALAADLVLLPMAAVITLGIRRLPTPARTPVAVASAMTLFALLIGWPFLGGFGRKPDNPSLLDRDYVGGSIAALAVIWGLALVAVVLRVVISRRRAAP